jgi:hypothetical protein
VFSSGGTIHASVLRGRSGDETVLTLLANSMAEHLGGWVRGTASTVSLDATPDDYLLDLMGRVDQYDWRNLELAEVPLDRVDSWARYAHLYKQRQQQEMLRILRDYDINPFAGYTVVYGNGQYSVAVPPVVESRHAGRWTVVNGLSRLLLLQREGRASGLCVVAKDVSAPPPASEITALSAVPVMVGKRGEPMHRYADFQQGNSRAIERVAHTLELLGDARPAEEED